MPSTVIAGSDVPAANGVALLVQVITCPDGAAQVQPEPYAPTGVTPAGIVSLTDTGELSLAPEAETVGVDRVGHRGAERGRRGAVAGLRHRELRGRAEADHVGRVDLVEVGEGRR